MIVRKAGGIVAVVAGIGGILTSAINLKLSGWDTIIALEHATRDDRLTWGGLMFAFWVIVLGATAIEASARLPGILVMISALVAGISGETFLAPFMAVAFVGGMLSVFGRSSTNGNKL